ncbi:hypothetical protein FACS1894139_10980 [Planctomycetales bacterium]|nr:hypothetical protein FACS1894139_10980 [Planctomycetales bacterium]
MNVGTVGAFDWLKTGEGKYDNSIAEGVVNKYLRIACVMIL